MNEKITLQELVELFAQKCQLNEADAELFVKEFLSLIEEALTRDKYVKVKGLGTFKLINIEARKSVDVNTGEAIEIKGGRVARPDQQTFCTFPVGAAQR